jgi:hypothetical protein
MPFRCAVAPSGLVLVIDERGNELVVHAPAIRLAGFFRIWSRNEFRRKLQILCSFRSPTLRPV